MDDVKLIKIGDDFDLTVAERYAAIRAGIFSAVPGISILLTIYNTMSDMHSKKIIKQRLDDYSCKIKANAYLIEQLFIDLNNTVNEQERSNTFFNHKKIIEKFIEDADVLDEELQKNITDYVVNCKERKLYKVAIDFLLKIPVYKLNGAKKIRYNEDTSVGLKKQNQHGELKLFSLDSHYTPILDLDDEPPQGGVQYKMEVSNSSRDRYVNKYNLEILFYCLKVLNKETYPQIDQFIKEKGWG